MRSLSGLLLLAAACGSPTPKPTIDNTGGDTDPPAASVWAPLMKTGASWTIHSEEIEGLGTSTFRAETVDVRTVDGATQITLKWVYTGEDGESAEYECCAPSRILIGKDGVRLLHMGDPAEATDPDELASPPVYPEPAVEDQKPEGFYTNVYTVDGERVACFGEGPPPGDDTPCEDVCFAELCVGEKKGIVVLDGTWAPDYMRYYDPGYQAAWTQQMMEEGE